MNRLILQARKVLRSLSQQCRPVGDKQYVFLPDADSEGSFTARQGKLGPASNGFFPVLDGLKMDDEGVVLDICGRAVFSRAAQSTHSDTVLGANSLGQEILYFVCGCRTWQKPVIQHMMPYPARDVSLGKNASRRGFSEKSV